MDSPRDFHILRVPPVSCEEWRNFIESRADFEVIESPVGRSVPGSSIELAGAIFLWLGHPDGTPVPFSWSNESIHVLGVDEGGLEFLNYVAAQFRATAMEG